MQSSLLFLFSMVVFTSCSAQKADNPVVGLWQNKDNPNNYGIFSNDLNYLEVDYDPNSEKVSILAYKYGFTDDCTRKAHKDLNSQGLMLVVDDVSDDDNNICYGYTFPEANELFLEVWASNQNVTFKRIKALPKNVQSLVDNRKP